MMTDLQFSPVAAGVIPIGLACLSLCIPTIADADSNEDVDLSFAGNKERLATLNEQLGINTSWSEMRDETIADLLDDGEIDGDDYECTPGPLKLWLEANLAAIDPLTLLVFDYVDGFGWAGYHKIYIDRDASDDYIGANGEHTRELRNRHKDANRFWNVYTDDVLLMGMHGIDVSHDEKMVPLIIKGFGVGEGFAQYIVDLLQGLIVGETVDLTPFFGPDEDGNPLIFEAPGIPGGYSNPLLTFNAFALSAQGYDILGDGEIVPDMIVMGDGVLQVITDIGFGVNGPDIVHAHEFAHHVQLELGVINIFEQRTPMGTRRTELMADAFGAYFAHHARGAAFQTKRITDAIATIYSNGDCEFDSPGHHGTPNQRGAAAAWGADVVDSTMNRGYIIDSSDMVDLFDAYLPILVAPDAP